LKNSASIIVERAEFANVLSRLKTLSKATRQRDKTLEVTVCDNYLKLVVPGINLLCKARTNGSAKFTIPLWHFTNMVKAAPDLELYISLEPNEIRFRSFRLKVETTFFETDAILRSIDLPVNYTHIDIARMYLSGRYTPEEIAFNNLTEKVTHAITRLKIDIDKVTNILKPYGFDRQAVDAIIKARLK